MTWTDWLFPVVFVAVLTAFLWQGYRVIWGKDDDEDDPPEPVKPQQPAGHPPLICPNPYEHFCEFDPIDTAKLERLEEGIAEHDPQWYLKMTKKTGGKTS